MLTLILALALGNANFGPEAVWHPDAGFRQSIISACANRGAGFADCFAEQMKTAGASAQALAFTHAIHDDGYMQGFRSLGPIAIAAVMYPFRANENNGLLIINGEPSPIDVDALNKLPADEMKADTAYEALLKVDSNAALWPGDRASSDDLLALAFPDGSREIVAGYRVQAGCHACAVLGQAFFAFNFNQTGKLIETKFTGFTSGYGGITAVPQKIITVKPNTTFTVLLPANRTTGYSWMLDPSSITANLQSMNHNYESSGTGIGAAGEERFTFRAAHAGESKMLFTYVRPWEKNTAPAKKLDLLVRVR